MSTTLEAVASAVISGESLLDAAGLISEDQLAKELKTTRRTIQRMVENRTAPPRVRFGKKVFYRRSSVIDWLAAQEEVQRPTRTPRKRRAAA